MTATLERRLARLELVAPSPLPDDHDDFDGQRWWEAAPLAVRRYCDAVDLLCAAVGLDPLDGDAPGLGAWYTAHHPHLATILATVERHAAKGEPCPLGAVQHAILSDSFARLHAHYRAHLPSAGVPHAWLDAAWANGFGRSNLHGYHRADTDKGGASWVHIWRASGTTDPATRTIMGLGGPELVVLRADDLPTESPDTAKSWVAVRVAVRG